VDRVKERIAVARQALATLVEILAEPKNRIVRDASIQRFEYSFEAVWKAIKIYLRQAESIELASPKSVIRASLRLGLLSEEQTRAALQMAEDRNLTVHMYQEELAEKTFSRLSGYAALMDAWLIAIEAKLDQSQTELF
jgi:nucleotidyltransferase substrate binding protein (TIGR01987 family)